MRTKDEILEANHVYAMKSGDAQEIALLQQLHTLEVLIDIRDTLTADVTGRIAVLQDMVRHKGGEQ